MEYQIFSKKILMLAIISLLSVSMPVFAEDEDGRHINVPADGELLLPDDYDKAADKKCMTVCDRWGEDCIINPRTGSRKCRRVCKSFTEECF